MRLCLRTQKQTETMIVFGKWFRVYNLTNYVSPVLVAAAAAVGALMAYCV